MSKSTPKPSLSDAQFAPVRAITAIVREFDKIARDTPVSITQYRLMLYLKDGPRSAGEVAATSLVSKATISGHIASLRENEWISAEIEAHDRRVTRLLLTETGREALADFERLLLNCLKSFISEDDRARVLSDLTHLYTSLSAIRET
ncbi:MarR family transcriptional regulator [Paraburkholderia sp. 5N]|uniref:MarR family transcriptional regulator n=1 Tax=Paraburkholderia elongata TaxID=2675747 RepID=A0A972NNM4_9BURK|nr:MarR family transcriptional regulator [Paraburkholderia elongata]